MPSNSSHALFRTRGGGGSDDAKYDVLEINDALKSTHVIARGLSMDEAKSKAHAFSPDPGQRRKFYHINARPVNGSSKDDVELMRGTA